MKNERRRSFERIAVAAAARCHQAEHIACLHVHVFVFGNVLRAVLFALQRKHVLRQLRRLAAQDAEWREPPSFPEQRSAGITVPQLKFENDTVTAAPLARASRTLANGVAREEDRIAQLEDFQCLRGARPRWWGCR